MLDSPETDTVGRRDNSLQQTASQEIKFPKVCKSQLTGMVLLRRKNYWLLFNTLFSPSTIFNKPTDKEIIFSFPLPQKISFNCTSNDKQLFLARYEATSFAKKYTHSVLILAGRWYQTFTSCFHRRKARQTSINQENERLRYHGNALSKSNSKASHIWETNWSFNE